ncbi:MAG: XRE family transcriptional regulator, partial [Eubacterium sp.]
MIKVRLSVLLGEKRISQAELARRAGIRPNTI